MGGEDRPSAREPKGAHICTSGKRHPGAFLLAALHACKERLA